MAGFDGNYGLAPAVWVGRVPLPDFIFPKHVIKEAARMMQVGEVDMSEHEWVGDVDGLVNWWYQSTSCGWVFVIHGGDIRG